MMVAAALTTVVQMAFPCKSNPRRTVTDVEVRIPVCAQATGTVAP